MANHQLVDSTDVDYALLNKFPNNHFIWLDENQKRVFLPKAYLKLRDEIEELEVRADDIWVLSYPKAGTTWTQEMVWCIVNDLDFEGAKHPIHTRVPFMEYTMFIPEDRLHEHPDITAKSVQTIANLPSPRYIKSHLPWYLLPKGIRDGLVQPKLIYVFRNPKDVCMSYYNHYCVFEGFQGTLEDFCELYVKHKVSYGSILDNIQSYLEEKHRENLLIITFEEMKRDLPSVIKKTATFLGKELTSDEVGVLAEHLSFENMKNNPAVNNDGLIRARLTERQLDPATAKDFGRFMNKGQVGYYKEMMPEKYIKILNSACDDFEQKTGYSFQI